MKKKVELCRDGGPYIWRKSRRNRARKLRCKLPKGHNDLHQDVIPRGYELAMTRTSRIGLVNTDQLEICTENTIRWR